MGSSGKKKTTMAKLARENRLRERRLSKQAKKDARKHASFDHDDATQSLLEPETALAAVEPVAPAVASDEPPTSEHTGDGLHDDALRAFRQIDPEPSDPRAKEVALRRLRDAPDEELVVFERKLQADALDAGANEQEMREAQRAHPGHDA